MMDHITRNTCSVTEDQPNLLNNASESERYFVGVCTGLFAATAAATCQTQQEIIDISPEIIATAFYTGLEATRRSNSIEPETNTWARVVRCAEANDIREQLAKFHQTKVLLQSIPLVLAYPLETMTSDSLKGYTISQMGIHQCRITTLQHHQRAAIYPETTF